jgi:very-short-patch-repair endonuclease
MTRITVTQYRALVKRPRKPSGKFRDRHMTDLIDYLSGLGYEVKTEYKFHPTRRWRFDIAIPELKIAVEYEGIYGKGQSRHTSAGGYTGDCDKYNEAAILGWRVLRFTAKNIRKAFETVGRAAE